MQQLLQEVKEDKKYNEIYEKENERDLRKCKKL